MGALKGFNGVVHIIVDVTQHVLAEVDETWCEFIDEAVYFQNAGHWPSVKTPTCIMCIAYKDQHDGTPT